MFRDVLIFIIAAVAVGLGLLAFWCFRVRPERASVPGMPWKDRAILAVGTMFSFTLLYVISTAFLSHVYLFEWTARNGYCFLWVPVLVLSLLGRRDAAVLLSAGNWLGVVVGQVLDSAGFAADNCSGLPIVFSWLATAFGVLAVGLILRAVMRRGNMKFTSTNG